jgi:hypothetical protein
VQFSEQFVHSDAPTVEYVPFEHAAHSEVPPAEYVIAAHSKQLSFQKPYPAAHSLHVVSLEHSVQFSEQFLHSDALMSEYVPFEHVAHSVGPPAEYVIAAHSKQLPFHKPYPAAHSLQLASPVHTVQFSEQFLHTEAPTCEYVPFEHATHSEVPPAE